MNLETAEYKLEGLGKINILLGKNGSGKSRLFRNIEVTLHSSESKYGKAVYITPERGGVLVYRGQVDQERVVNIDNWVNERRKNQYSAFKEQSTAQFRGLKEIVLEEIEIAYKEIVTDPKDKTGEKPNLSVDTFDKYVDRINSLLDNIKIKKDKQSFTVFDRETDEEIAPGLISSGEAELISLGIEILIFAKECDPEKENILFMDEPDVHLHPDLQARLMHLIKDLVEENPKMHILIATHNTAILGALENYDGVRVAFMKRGDAKITFKEVSLVHKKIIPAFGAHPLSQLFNETPILFVEGEGDEWIWQRAVRSSEGKLKLYPRECGGTSKMNNFEKEAQKIIESIYDNAKAISLRDRDDKPEEIDDLGPIIRCRLSCRNAENLLLTDEVLSSLSISWEELQNAIKTWLENNKDHQHFELMKSFQDGGFDRKQFDTKVIVNDLMSIIGHSKPWQVAVGQSIGKTFSDLDKPGDDEGGLVNFLGEKFVNTIAPQE